MTVLEVSIDSLEHKLISVDSEIALCETFDVFLAGAENWLDTNRSYVDIHMIVRSMSGAVLWNHHFMNDDAVAKSYNNRNGLYLNGNFVINTERAAKEFSVGATYVPVSFVLSVTFNASDNLGENELISYGQSKMRLHNGYYTDGELVTDEMKLVEQHNVDIKAHEDIRTEISEIRQSTATNIDSKITQRLEQEVQDRNAAINQAIRDSGISSIPDTITSAVQSAQAAALSAKTAAAVTEIVADIAVDTKSYRDEVLEKISSIDDTTTEINRTKSEIFLKAQSFNDTYPNVVKTLEDNAKASSDSAKVAADAAKSVSEASEGVKAVLESVNTLNASIAKAEGFADKAEGSASLAQSSVESIENLTVNINRIIEQGKNDIAGQVGTVEGFVKTAGEYAQAAQNVKQSVDEIEGRVNSAVETAKNQATSASASASSASTSATNAQTAFNETNAIKSELSDVLTEAKGVEGRVEVVEGEVDNKMPYVSPAMLQTYNFARGNFNMRNVQVITNLHEGFLLRDSYVSYEDYFLVPATNTIGKVQPLGTIRLSVIEQSQTTIYSYSGSDLYKTSISGSGESLAFSRETISAMPIGVESMSGVVGYRITNGFIVCTNGNILSQDLATVVGSFYAVNARAYIRKNGNSFYFFDGNVKQFATLTVGDDGVPSITYNIYTQGDGRYYPITSTMYVKANNFGVLVGATVDNLGYLYRNMPWSDTIVYATKMKVDIYTNNVALLFLYDRVVALLSPETNINSSKTMTLARGLLAEESVYPSLDAVVSEDLKGNILYGAKVQYVRGYKQTYNLFTVK